MFIPSEAAHVTVSLSSVLREYRHARAMYLAVSADSWYVIGSLPITTRVQVTLGHAVEENASFPQNAPLKVILSAGSTCIESLLTVLVAT